jgi:hypothetical protein
MSATRLARLEHRARRPQVFRCPRGCAVRCEECELTDALEAAHRYAGAWALHVRAQLTADPAEAAAAAAAMLRHSREDGVVRPPDAVLLEYIDQQLAQRGPHAVPAVVAAMLQLLRLDVRHPGAVERLVGEFHRALPRVLQRLRDETGDPAPSPPAGAPREEYP